MLANAHSLMDQPNKINKHDSCLVTNYIIPPEKHICLHSRLSFYMHFFFSWSISLIYIFTQKIFLSCLTTYLFLLTLSISDGKLLFCNGHSEFFSAFVFIRAVLLTSLFLFFLHSFLFFFHLFSR